MNNGNKKRWAAFALMGFISCCLVISIALGGCEPLRKKFTRAKKKGSEETSEIPILEPMEYPKKVHTPQDNYQQYFTLWKAWHKELAESVADESGHKRQLYLLNQVVTNLTGMQQLLAQERQGGLKEALGKLRLIQSDIEAPVSSRPNSSLRIELDSIEKKIRKDYPLSKVKDSISQ